MKKIKGFIYQYIGAAEGKVNFDTTPKSSLDLKILDNNNKEVKEYDYILPTDSKAIIILKFQWEKEFEEVKASEIKYLLPKSNAWEINNESIQIKNKFLFVQEIKKIHKKLLKENQRDLFSIDERKSLPGSDNILYNITETEGKIQLNFYKKDATTTSSKVLLEDQIKIEPKYYVTSEIAFSEGGDLTEEENSKPKLTAGWIIFITILAAALLLIIIFRKKILKWIRGERAQEKKVKEQLDIF